MNVVHDVKLWYTYASEAQSVRSSPDFAYSCNPARTLLESLRRRLPPLLDYVQLAASQVSAGSPLLRSVWDFNYHILSVQREVAALSRFSDWICANGNCSGMSLT